MKMTGLLVGVIGLFHKRQGISSYIHYIDDTEANTHRR